MKIKAFKMKLKCKECGSVNVEILDIYDRDAYVNTGQLIDRGNAICNECDCEFNFINTYKVELEKSETF